MSQHGLLINPFFSWASTAPAPLWRPCCDKHTWSLCPVPDTLHLKPLEFWNDEGLTYANELTGGWVPLGSLRIGCGHQKDHGKISELQFSALPGPQCPGRVEGLEVELSTRGQWFNQSLLNNEPLALYCSVAQLSITPLKDRAQHSFWVDREGPKRRVPREHVRVCNPCPHHTRSLSCILEQ